MEDWSGWSLLTASLAVADLTDPDRTWAFLRGQELVEDTLSGPAPLAEAVRTEEARGEITGWTLPRRVAETLALAGATLTSSNESDPRGALAAERWRRFNSAPPER